MISWNLSFLIFLFFSSVQAVAGTGLTIQGRILKPNGEPVTATSVQFQVQIRSPGAENCLLFQESHTLNLSSSLGVFSLPVGQGTRAGQSVDGGLALERVMSNRSGAMDLSLAATPCAYFPAATDSRKLIYSFNDGSGWQTLQAMNLTFTPQSLFAIEAKQLDQYGSGQLLRAVDASGNPAAAPALTPQQLTNLTNLFNGIWSGTAVNPNDLVNKAYVDSAMTGALPTIGSSGTYTKVTTDAQGRVVSGTTLLEADIPTLLAAGKVSGNAINSGTLGGSVAIATSGNIATTGSVSASQARVSQVQVFNGADAVTISAPALSGVPYSLVLPTTAGTAGYVLSTDGTGNLSWANPTAGAVLGVTSAGAPIVIGGTAQSPTVGITQAGSTQAGFLTSADWNAFNNKLGTSASFSGDVSGPYDNLTVNRLRGLPVSFASPTSGQVLRYNGSGWVNASLTFGDISGTLPATIGGTGFGTYSTGDMLYASGTSTLAKLSAGTSGHFLMSNGAGTAPSWSPVNLTGFFANGGNSFAATANLGTNDLQALNFRTATSTRMTIDTAGNVGIGTTAPGAVLQIADQNVATNLQVGPSAIASANAYLTLTGKNLGTPASAQIWSDFTGGFNFRPAAGQGYRFKDSSLNDKVIIDSSGNVGIGAANPGSNLAINTSQSSTSQGASGSFTQEIVNTNMTNGNWSGIAFRDNNNDAVVASIQTRYLDHTTDYGEIHFSTRGPSGWSTRLMIDQNGSAGIGTTTPATRLDVAGSVRIGDGGETCGPLYGGGLRFNGGSLQLCNGSNWQSLGVAGSGLQSLNGSANTSQTFSVGSAGTMLSISTIGGTHTFNLPSASSAGVAAGTISKNEYDLFNQKLSSANGFVQGGNSFGASANLGTNDFNALNLQTSTTTRMTITSAGNIGIGTTNPASALTVAGDITPDVDSTRSLGNSSLRYGNAYIRQIFSGANTMTLNSTSSQIRINPNGATAAVFDPSGNVGVGTTSPSSKFEVLGMGNFRTGYTASDYGVTIQGNTAGYSVMNSYQASVGPASLVLNSNGGNIGIGTTNPVSKLHVAGDVTILGGSTATRTYNNGDFGLASGYSSPIAGRLLFGDNSGWKFFMSRGTAASPTDLVTFQDNGNVGIGTTTPGYKLDVAGSINATQILVNGTDVSSSAGAWTVNGSNVYRTVGNVGIGTATPIARLHVFGGFGAPSTTATPNGQLILSDPGTGLISTMGIDNPGVPYYWIQPRHTSAAAYYNTALNPLGGNVGIGTTAPGKLLDVYGSSGANITARVQNAGSGRAELMLDGGPASSGDALLSLAHGTTTRWSLYNAGSGADRLQIDSGSITGVMTITQSGNVGIGTSTPSTRFDVAGGIRVGLESAGCGSTLTGTLRYTGGNLEICNGSSWLALTTGGGSGFTNGGNSFGGIANLGTNDSFNLNFRTATSTRMTIAANGNLGIGTTSPTSQLTIAGAGSGKASIELDRLGNWAGTSSVVQWNNSTSSSLWQLGMRNNSTDNFYLTQTQSGTTVLTASIGGNVGIGTGSPGALLHVGADSASTISYRFDAGSAQGTMRFTSDASANYIQSGVTTTSGSSKDLRFGPYATSSPFLTIQATSGNIGVGTTSPNAKMDIAGDLNVDAVSPTTIANNTTGSPVGLAIRNKVSPTTGGGPVMVFQGDTSNVTMSSLGNMWEAAANTNSSLYFSTRTAGSLSEKMRINSTGNVGIGTVTPATRLDVSGTLRVSDGGETCGALFAGGIRYNGGNLQFCNGSNWQSLAVGSGAGFTNGGNSFGGIANLGTNDSFSLNFRTASTTRMTLATDGNVGIGTTAPSALLSVGASSQFQVDSSGRISTGGAQVGNNPLSLNTTAGQGIAMTDRSVNGMVYVGRTAGGGLGGNSSWIGFGGDGSASNNWIDFSGYGGSAHMRINKDGNVGIGTNSPTGKVEISSASGNHLKLSGALSDGGIWTTGNIQQIGSWITSANRLSLDLVNGNVGIGTSTPVTLLNLQTPSAASTIVETIRLNNPGSGSGTAISFQATGNEQARISGFFDTTTLQSLAFSTGNTPTERLRITGVGSIGIGTTTPSASAQLEIVSTNRGLLIPRMTTAQRDAISTPVNGLQIYNTSTNTLNLHNGTGWIALSIGGGATDLDGLSDVVTSYANNNMILGQGSGGSITTATDTVILGPAAGTTIATGNRNTVVGSSAANDGGLGQRNTVIGAQAGWRSSGDYNVLIGDLAGGSGSYNTRNYSVFIGQSAGGSSRSNNSIYMGYNAGIGTTGTTNIAIGHNSYSNTSTGSSNVAIGENTLYSGVVGNSNTAVGSFALFNNSSATGSFNVGLGANTGSNNSGSSNTWVGYSAGVSSGSASMVVGVGTYALGNSTGINNVALGNWAGSGTSGSNNTFLGGWAGFTNSTANSGSNNTFVGAGAAQGFPGKTGSDNTVLGTNAAQAFTSAAQNTILGSSSGNTLTTGSNNILLGYNIQVPAIATSNYMSLGNLIYGNLSSGQVGIGATNTASSAALEISSTNSGLLIPRLTTAQRNTISSPANGLQIYNTSTNVLNFYNGSGWVALSSSGGTGDILNNGNSFGSSMTIGTNDSQTLNFETSSTNRMTITSAGSIGIGTTAPAVSLDVIGGMRFGADGCWYTDMQSGTINSYSCSSNPTAALNLQVNSQTILMMNGTGKVGIGTTTPSAKLTVAGAVATPANVVSSNTVDLALSNTHTLAAVGGNSITLQNMSNGAAYTIIVEDGASRTYSFSGCTNTYWSPAAGPTAASTRTIFGIMTVAKAGNTWDCYVTWSTGFQ